MDVYAPLFFIHYWLYSFLLKLSGQNISINQQLYYDMIQYQFIPPEPVNWGGVYPESCQKLI